MTYSRLAASMDPILRFAVLGYVCRSFLHGSDNVNIAQEITCFSYDDQHSFHLGDSSLRYYYPPRLPADLNRGYDTFQKLDDSADEHLDALLETIMALEKETGKKCEADIITWRGMMTKVSCLIRAGFPTSTRELTLLFI